MAATGCPGRVRRRRWSCGGHTVPSTVNGTATKLRSRTMVGGSGRERHDADATTVEAAPAGTAQGPGLASHRDLDMHNGEPALAGEKPAALGPGGRGARPPACSRKGNQAGAGIHRGGDPDWRARPVSSRPRRDCGSVHQLRTAPQSIGRVADLVHCHPGRVSGWRRSPLRCSRAPWWCSGCPFFGASRQA